jgi:phage head maturation protease
MPWDIVPDEPRCPASEPWGVVKEADDELEGCHASRAEALAQLAALNAAEENENMSDKQTANKPTEIKSASFPGGTKVIDAAQGIVEHLVTVFGVFDEGHDISHPGSFAKTLNERGGKVRVVDSHNYDSVMRVIGKPLDIKEVGRDSLPQEVRQLYPEASGGVLARTQFLMNTPEGRGVFDRLAAEAIEEWSYGYDTVVTDFDKVIVDGEERVARNLREIKLYEYSPVLWGMNPATVTMSAKGAGESDEMTEDKGVTGAANLPLASRDRPWDASAANARVRSWADAEDEPNAKYRRAFFWYDGDNPDQFGSYKLQFADVIDGELQAIPRGLFAVAGVLQGARGGADIPQADQDAIKRRVATYYGRMRSEFDDDGIVPPWEKTGGEPGEGKVGRVLSAANANRIGAALTSLIEVLEAAGIDVPGVGQPEKDEDEKPKGHTIVGEPPPWADTITMNAPGIIDIGDSKCMMLLPDALEVSQTELITERLNEWLESDRKVLLLSGGEGLRFVKFANDQPTGEQAGPGETPPTSKEAGPDDVPPTYDANRLKYEAARLKHEIETM